MCTQHTANHYDNSTQEYERRWKGYLENTHNMLLEALLPDMKEDDTILDASCGTGLLARQLLVKKAPFKELVLNDISPRMLGMAKAHLPEDPRITYTAWPAEDLQFNQNRFTKVICLNAFHHYQNPSVVVRHFKRVLVPNGRLYLLDWDRTGWFRFINALIRWSGKEMINTMNLKEVIRLLQDHHYNIDYTDQWRYQYWRLFLVVAGFQPWRKFHK